MLIYLPVARETGAENNPACNRVHKSHQRTPQKLSTSLRLFWIPSFFFFFFFCTNVSVNHEPWTRTLSATLQKTHRLTRRCCSRCCRTAKSCEKVNRKLKYGQLFSHYSYLRSFGRFSTWRASKVRARTRVRLCESA